jgi:hypothetical protein
MPVTWMLSVAQAARDCAEWTTAPWSRGVDRGDVEAEVLVIEPMVTILPPPRCCMRIDAGSNRRRWSGSGRRSDFHSPSSSFQVLRMLVRHWRPGMSHAEALGGLGDHALDLRWVGDVGLHTERAVAN